MNNAIDMFNKAFRSRIGAGRTAISLPNEPAGASHVE